jgi:hypothetical protein
MRRVMVQYTVKPDRAAENEELVRSVFDELVRTRPDGLRYATFQLPNGVSFLHLAETEDDRDPLAGVQAVQHFRRGIADRCDEAPGRDRAPRDRLLPPLRRLTTVGWRGTGYG